MADINIDTILKLPKNQRIGILVGVALLIIVLYWFFIFEGHSFELDQRNELLTKKQHELDEQRVVLADLPRFKKETEDAL